MLFQRSARSDVHFCSRAHPEPRRELSQNIASPAATHRSRSRAAVASLCAAEGSPFAGSPTGEHGGRMHLVYGCSGHTRRPSVHLGAVTEIRTIKYARGQHPPLDVSRRTLRPADDHTPPPRRARPKCLMAEASGCRRTSSRGLAHTRGAPTSTHRCSVRSWCRRPRLVLQTRFGAVTDGILLPASVCVVNLPKAFQYPLPSAQHA